MKGCRSSTVGLVITKRLAELTRVAWLLPAVCAAACGSINAVDNNDAGGRGAPKPGRRARLARRACPVRRARRARRACPVRRARPDTSGTVRYVRYVGHVGKFGSLGIWGRGRNGGRGAGRYHGCGWDRWRRRHRRPGTGGSTNPDGSDPEGRRRRGRCGRPGRDGLHARRAPVRHEHAADLRRERHLAARQRPARTSAPPGSCVGVCNPGAKTCVGNIPQLCDGQGQWQAAPACTFVCRQGDCTGVCMPGARQCSSSGMPQSCNADGAWDSGQACPFVCSQGVCSGAVQARSVQLQQQRPADLHGGGRVAVGPGVPVRLHERRVRGIVHAGRAPVRERRSADLHRGGAWQSGTACPYVCAAGVCGGSCVPGATRCNNGQKQICDAPGRLAGHGLAAGAGADEPRVRRGPTVAWVETTLSSSTIITPRQRADDR